MLSAVHAQRCFVFFTSGLLWRRAALLCVKSILALRMTSSAAQPVHGILHTRMPAACAVRWRQTAADSVRQIAVCSPLGLLYKQL